MHQSSMEEMKAFVARLPKGSSLRIGDIGSREAYGNYRRCFRDPKWEYSGLDLLPGPNVDVVLPDPYSWPNIESDSFDVVVSGQTAEHTERPWLWMKEVARIMRPGGIVCSISAHQWPYHPDFGLDCWRIFSDGMKGLMEDANLTVLKVYMNQTDTVGIATKGAASDIWSQE